MDVFSWNENEFGFSGNMLLKHTYCPLREAMLVCLPFSCSEEQQTCHCNSRINHAIVQIWMR